MRSSTYAVALGLTVICGALLLPLSAELQAQTDAAPHTEQFVRVNGISLHYLDWGGKGDALVFLTGYGAQPHVFDQLAPKFTSPFRVVALTRRGRAPSDVPPAGYDLDTLVSDIKGLTDALSLTRVHLVAHSFGGAEATRLAAMYPPGSALEVRLKLHSCPRPGRGTGGVPATIAAPTFAQSTLTEPVSGPGDRRREPARGCRSAARAFPGARRA